MYKITVLSDGAIYPLHIPGTDDLILIDPQLTLEVGSPGNLSFQITAYHPHYNKIHPLISELYVFQDGSEIFRGRIISREEDFYKTGTVICEGDLAYLLDSQQRAFSYQGNIIDFIKSRLDQHNSQVEDRKKYLIGKVTVIDSNNYINRSSESPINTLECLKTRLAETHGGFFRTRLEGGKRYLDYVTDYGGINSQIIRFGENLLDITKHLDPTTIITALIPIGASVEVTNKDGTIDNKKIDIKSVNGGKDYIYDDVGVQKYGWITGVQEWQDVTLPENLIKKAQVYLQESLALPTTMELTAVDLSQIDVSIDRLKVGYWTQVTSLPHDLTGIYLLTGKTINISDPSNDTIILGGKIGTLSGTTAKNKQDMSLKIQQTAESTSKEINAKIENATQLITGGLGGYIVIGRAEDGHPEELLIMDAPTKQSAKNVIRLNKNGLGFSTSGYNGVYRNAWTIDGNLVADFVTTGSMLADRIRGGTLEVGGKSLGKDGQILLRDSNGTILAVMDKNGMDIRKGSIIGSTLVLGGRDNINGSMTVNSANGTVACTIDGAGLYAIQGTVGGWSLGTDSLTSESGIIMSYEGTNHNNRATMNNASFKIWVNAVEKCYLGRGGYNGWGSSDSGLLHIGGRSTIELDGNSGKVNAGGDIQAQGKVKTFGGVDCEGSLTCGGNAYFTGGRFEVSRDIIAGGRVDGSNISEMAGRIAALEQKVK